MSGKDESAAEQATTAQPVAVAQDEREAFEKHFKARRYNLCRMDKDRDQYAFPAANGAWEAWQARASLPVVAVAEGKKP